MAMTKEIKEGNPREGEAVESVTTTVPHEADASSAPGPYNDLDVNRPPVSTNRPDVPIAHSLVAGAGAPTPDETPPEDYEPANLYVSSKDHVVPAIPEPKSAKKDAA